MTTSTDDQLRSHLRTLATTPTRSAEEVERDVLHRVARRRRRRRQSLALGGTAVLALLAAATALLAGVGDSDTGTDVKTVEKQRAASTPDKAPVQQLVNMVEIQRFEHDGADRTTIEFDARLPITDLDPVGDITKADSTTPAWGIQYSSDWWMCGDHHWDETEPPGGMVTLHFPAQWFENPEYALEKPVVYPDLASDGDSSGVWRNMGGKIIVCPQGDSVEVVITSVRLDGTEDNPRHFQLVSVSVEDGSTKVVVDGRPAEPAS